MSKIEEKPPQSTLIERNIGSIINLFVNRSRLDTKLIITESSSLKRRKKSNTEKENCFFTKITLQPFSSMFSLMSRVTHCLR